MGIYNIKNVLDIGKIEYLLTNIAEDIITWRNERNKLMFLKFTELLLNAVFRILLENFYNGVWKYSYLNFSVPSIKNPRYFILKLISTLNLINRR